MTVLDIDGKRFIGIPVTYSYPVLLLTEYEDYGTFHEAQVHVLSVYGCLA